jgi:CHAD domain-containing protein
VGLTVKSDIAIVGGLHRREELEAPATRTLDPGEWPESEALSRVISVIGRRRLIERFRVKQERHEAEARVGGAVVVASVDVAQVVAAGRAAGSLQQLEVELRSGPEEALRALGQEIAASGVGVPEARSKLAIASEMAEAAAAVAPDDSLANAGKLVLRRQLVRMLDRETGARLGDVPAIKQMRVATRRMRAAWRVFGAAYRRGARRRYVTELRRVARALGEVRDLDVLLEGLPRDAALAPLAAAWRERRAAAHKRLVAMLDDEAYDTFVRDYLEFSADPLAGIAGPDQDTVAGMAPARLAASADRMRAAGAAALAGTDDVAWHALRRGARRLRYTVEAVRPALDEAAAADAIARLVHVQDALGAMNDAAVAAHEAEQWLVANPEASPTTVAAIASYARRQRDEIERLRALFASIWQEAAGLFTER